VGFEEVTVHDAGVAAPLISPEPTPAPVPSIPAERAEIRVPQAVFGIQPEMHAEVESRVAPQPSVPPAAPVEEPPAGRAPAAVESFPLPPELVQIETSRDRLPEPVAQMEEPAQPRRPRRPRPEPGAPVEPEPLVQIETRQEG
jgi:hypothetical protein